MSTSPTYGLSEVDLACALCEVFGWKWVDVWDFRQLSLGIALAAYYRTLRRRKGGWTISREAALDSEFGRTLIEVAGR
jgi:hypothetical protein